MGFLDQWTLLDPLACLFSLLEAISRRYEDSISWLQSLNLMDKQVKPWNKTHQGSCISQVCVLNIVSSGARSRQNHVGPSWLQWRSCYVLHRESHWYSHPSLLNEDLHWATWRRLLCNPCRPSLHFVHRWRSMLIHIVMKFAYL